MKFRHSSGCGQVVVLRDLGDSIRPCPNCAGKVNENAVGMATFHHDTVTPFRYCGLALVALVPAAVLIGMGHAATGIGLGLLLLGTVIGHEKFVVATRPVPDGAIPRC